MRAEPEQAVALTALLAHRREMVDDRKRLIMRLRDHLTSIFPALDRALDYGVRTAAVVVSEQQTPARSMRPAGTRSSTTSVCAFRRW